MFQNIAAIDIGTTSVRAVAVRTGLRDFQVRFLAMEDIDQGNPDRSTAVSQALRKLVDDNDLGEYILCTTMPMENALIRNLSFPFSDISKIAAVLPAEAEEQLPIDPAQLILDFQPLYRDGEETSVLAAAVPVDTLQSFNMYFTGAGLEPSFIGLEAMALCETYRYFSPPADETAIVLNIGRNKTIVIVVDRGRPVYTRALSTGTVEFDRAAADALKMDQAEASDIMSRLQLDLTSLENNHIRGTYSSIGLTRPALKKLFNAVSDAAANLARDVMLTVAASPLPRGGEPSRIILSGGGASIPGMASILAPESSIPVVPLPFIDELKDNPAGGRFAIAFGTVLLFLNSGEKRIDFIHGRSPYSIHGGGLKPYYFAAGMAALTLFFVLISIAVNGLINARTDSRFDSILEERYRRYFHARPAGGDPLEEARKLVKKESREFGDMAKLVGSDDSVLDLLRDVVASFPGDNTFEMQNLVINERIVRMDGSIGSSAALDEFKKKLEELKGIESVSLNIRYARKNDVKFSVTIKQKITTAAQPAREE